MIGIVVVSHSRPLAQAAVDFANELIAQPTVPIRVAAGLDDGSLGTDTAAISKAISSMSHLDGVLVFVDLGSAIISTQLAIGLLDLDIGARVTIARAPLIEGLLAAVVTAATGASLDDVAREASQAHDAKTAQIAGDKTEISAHLGILDSAKIKKKNTDRALIWRTTVKNTHGIHIRPAAAIVTTLKEYNAEVKLSNTTLRLGPVTATSINRISTLQIQQGHILQARITGPDAPAARDALAHLAANNFGEITSIGDGTQTVPDTQLSASPNDYAENARQRLCPIGPITRQSSRPSTAGYHLETPKRELEKFTKAAQQVAAYLGHLATNATAIPGILEAQRTMLEDRELHHDIVSRITEGFSAVDAVDAYLSKQAHLFDVLTDTYMRERGQDLRSLRRLLLLSLTQRPLNAAGPDAPSIWLVDELDAASAARLDPALCLGVITTSGSSAGHGVLSARARGIPVLPGIHTASDLADGRVVAFDPVTYELWLDPDETIHTTIEQRNAVRREHNARALQFAHEPACTPSGQRIVVEANVGTLDDARAGVQAGAEGFGIVRTEILFSSWPTAPTIDAQVDTYRTIGSMLSQGTMTVRTWDSGGDKPLSFIKHMAESNSALGERGIRAMARHEQIFIDQLTSIVLASKDVNARILLPMVTTPQEVRWTRNLLDRIYKHLDLPPIPVGIMIEVPAAAIRAKDFADVVDYVSIGTNDLTQYVQACDRTNPVVRKLAHQDCDAIFDLIGHVGRSLPGIPMAVCGDLASDPEHVSRLLSLGVSELSVLPPMVPTIKQAIRMA